MSQFSANTGDIAEGGSRLAGLSGEIAELHGQVGEHYSAAAGTPIEGQLDEVMDTWGVVLPQFGATSDSLHLALGTTASNYEAADGVTADAAAAAEAPARPGRA